MYFFHLQRLYSVVIDKNIIINIRDKKDVVMAYFRAIFGSHQKRLRTGTEETTDKTTGNSDW
jgi:hypothetical protein